MTQCIFIFSCLYNKHAMEYLIDFISCKLSLSLFLTIADQIKLNLDRKINIFEKHN